jgi:hypothetical protein
MWTAETVAGPWTAAGGEGFPLCNNPSGAIHPITGDAWLLCHGPGAPKGYGPGLFLCKSTSKQPVLVIHVLF